MKVAPVVVACHPLIDVWNRSHPSAGLKTTLESFPSIAYQTERGVMGERHIALDYRQLSSEDQRTFNRWLTANAIAGAVFAAGIVAMALIGSRSVGPHGAAVASSTKGSDTATSEPRPKQSGVVSTQEPKTRHRLF